MLSFKLRKTFFSKLAYELGPLVETSHLETNENLNFYRIEEIDPADVQDENGPLAYKPMPVPVELNAVKVQLNELNAQLNELNARVKCLEITPAILQVCESVKVDEQVLIEEHLPLLCSGLGDREIRFNHMKRIILNGKDYTGEIANFFKIPIVKRLENFRESKEFKAISIDRDELAHEALMDGSHVLKKWEQIVNFYNDKESGNEFDPKWGQDIGLIHDRIIEIAENSGNEL